MCFCNSRYPIAYSQYRSISAIDIDILFRSTLMRWKSDFRIRYTVHIYACMLMAHTLADP